MIKTIFFSISFGTLLLYAFIVFIMVAYIMIKATNNALIDIDPKNEHSAD
jgi:hypothetical protein